MPPKAPHDGLYILLSDGEVEYENPHKHGLGKRAVHKIEHGLAAHLSIREIHFEVAAAE